MIFFTTYSNDLYSESRDFCIKMAKSLGKADKYIAYSENDIDTGFREKYSHILQLKAGNGMWLWKPYFIKKTLDIAEDNDVVIYYDAGTFPIRSFRHIIRSMDDDIWVTDIPLVEKQYTKYELIARMDCNTDKYTESNQIQANYFAVKKTERGVKFVDEWLRLCCEDDNILYSTDLSKNAECFIEHRADQSVLSLLAKKWGVQPHTDPSQNGRFPERLYRKNRLYKETHHKREYPVLVILHRGKRPDAKICINQWISSFLPRFIVQMISPSFRRCLKEKKDNDIKNGC